MLHFAKQIIFLICQKCSRLSAKTSSAICISWSLISCTSGPHGLTWRTFAVGGMVGGRADGVGGARVLDEAGVDAAVVVADLVGPTVRIHDTLN